MKSDTWLMLTKHGKNKYPQVVHIDCDDGGGEAIKDSQDENWRISVPAGDLRFYGSRPEMEVEVCRYFEQRFTFSLEVKSPEVKS